MVFVDRCSGFAACTKRGRGLSLRLRQALGGGPRLWIKRDDLTGLEGGGNKTRKLEFIVGEALRAGADMLVTIGAIQSNHTRQTAAAAARAWVRVRCG